MSYKVMFNRVMTQMAKRHNQKNYKARASFRKQRDISKMARSAPAKTSRRRAHWEKPSQLKAVKKKVSRLSRQLESTSAVFTSRIRSTHHLRAAVNSNLTIDFSNGGTIGQLESGCNSLPYWNPATNLIINQDAGAGTYQREITASMYTKLTLRNNYQVPCNIRVYLCLPKDDTSLGPVVLYQNGIADQGGISHTSTLAYPSDSEMLKEMWSLKCTKRTLQPGQEMSLSHFKAPFQYDFSKTDTHALSYQKRYNGYSWLIRITGVLGHDTVTTNEQGILASGIDLVEDVVFKYFYDAGKDLRFIKVADNAAGFSNSGVCSSKPIADNQIYSVA